MIFEEYKPTCHECGADCPPDQAFCKKCKPKKVLFGVLSILGSCLGCSFLSVLISKIPMGGLWAGILTWVVYIPFFVVIAKVRSQFKV